MTRRVAEMQMSSKPWMIDENWKKNRRGWCFGDESFRKELLDCLDQIVAPAKRESFSGEEMLQHDTAEAERLVQRGLAALEITEEELSFQKKGSPQKYAIAWLIRKNTRVRPLRF
jgi:hypothetical protein